MADNFTYSDANGVERIIRATEISTVYTPHNVVASLEDGTPTPVCDATSLPVRIEQSTAFGELMSAEMTPFVQATAVYNRLPANMRTYTASGGSATLTGGEFVCTTGTISGGFGVIRSARALNYKGGVGGRFRGTGRFPTGGIANSLQGIGFFNVGDALLFGYSGTTFGIIYQKGGFQEVRTITIAGASGGSTSLTLTLNGTVYTIPLTSGTTAHNAWEIEQWLQTNASSTWNAYQNGNTVTISATTDGAKNGTYSFSHATATGTIAQVTAGVTKTTTFIPQANWNVNTASFLDPSKGNVYQIDFQYLGYGNIFFYVENPDTGRFMLVHRIKYANANTSPSLGNPSMHCGVFAASLGSTTNITVASACVASFLQGSPGRTRNPRSFSNSKSVGTTLTNILTIRNRDIFGGRANQVEIEPLILSVYTESTKGARVYVATNATLGGETNYSYLEEVTLVSEVDTAATTVTNGTPLLDLRIPQGGAQIDLTPLRIRIPPNVTITVALAVNSGAASDSGAGFSWYEDL